LFLRKQAEKEEADLIKRISPIDWKMAIYSVDLYFISSKRSKYRLND